jgi:hypothetical protein
MVQDNPNSSSTKQGEGGTGELHWGSWGSHVGVNKTLDNIRLQYYQLLAWRTLTGFANNETPAQQAKSPNLELGPDVPALR